MSERGRTWTLTMPSRPIARGESDYFPQGVPSRPLDATYEAHERAEMLGMVGAAEALGEGPRRTALLEEIRVLHELKALFDGRVLTLDESLAFEERVKAGKVVTVGRPPERAAAASAGQKMAQPLQTTFLPPEGTSSMFPIPERVRRRMGYDPDNALATRAYARTDDPSTSHEAAGSLTEEELRVSQRDVLDCFRRYGAMCDAEFLQVYRSHQGEHDWRQQSDSGLRSRRDELVDGGLMRDSGDKAPMVSGRRSIVWEVAAA